MDCGPRGLIELSRFTFEHFIGEPAKEQERANCRREAEEERDANEFESMRKVFSHG